MIRKKIIDVIVPCWNVQEYVKPLLKSIEKQTLDKGIFNLILIDNNSSDKTLKILNDYAKNREYVHVFKQNIQGPGPARQKGLDEAVSEWVIHLDSDGYISKRYLETFYKAINKKYDFIFSDNNLYLHGLNDKPNFWKRFKRSFYNGWFNIMPWPDTTDPRSKMYRRDLIKDVKWTKHKRGEDWIFFADCMKRIRKNSYRRVIFNNMYFDFYGRPGSTNDLVKINPEYLNDQIESHFIAYDKLSKSNHRFSKRMAKKAKKIADKSQEAKNNGSIWNGL